jgi:predicted Zn-dependent peptidase
MKVEVDATGLTAEEVREAVAKAKKWKQDFSVQEWQEARKKILIELYKLIKDDTDFTLQLIDAIREHHPGLLKDV